MILTYDVIKNKKTNEKSPLNKKYIEILIVTGSKKTSSI